MTRINTIDFDDLTDQHLMAEYRELPMVMGSMRRSLKSKNGIRNIPPKFTLNSGHVKFFYNKGRFLKWRYENLIEKLTERGYNLDENREVDFSVFDLYPQIDWEPTNEDMKVSAERILIRVAEKPSWYKYLSKQLCYNTYVQLLNSKYIGE